MKKGDGRKIYGSKSRKLPKHLLENGYGCGYGYRMKNEYEIRPQPTTYGGYTGRLMRFSSRSGYFLTKYLSFMRGPSVVVISLIKHTMCLKFLYLTRNAKFLISQTAVPSTGGRTERYGDH